MCQKKRPEWLTPAYPAVQGCAVERDPTLQRKLSKRERRRVCRSCGKSVAVSALANVFIPGLSPIGRGAGLLACLRCRQMDLPGVAFQFPRRDL
jgi:hypothetical protein